MEMHGQSELIQAIVAASKSWIVLTLIAGLPEIWVLALALHLGRPAALRTLRKCTLRFGADAWWLSYVLMRDLALILAFAFSAVFLMPDVVSGLELPLTGALSGLLLFWALLVKLLRDADDNPGDFRTATILLVLGAAFYLVPLVLGPKAAGALEGSELARFLTTRTNPTWALALLIGAVGGYVATGAYVFAAVLARSRPRRRLTRAPGTMEPGEQQAT